MYRPRAIGSVRRALLGLCAGLLLGGAPGCHRPPSTKVGDPCAKNNDCTYAFDDDGKVIRVQRCVLVPPPDGYPAEAQPRICSRTCQSRTDCPVGYECIASPDLTEQIDDTDAEGQPTKRTVPLRLCFPCRGHFDCPAGLFCEEDPGAEMTDGGTRPRRCQERAQPAAGAFGMDCAVAGDAACRAQSMFCHRDLPDDPDAYCTRECKADADCPLTMFCGTAEPGNEPPGMRRRCLRRTHCSSCRSDAECTGVNSLCVQDDRGRGYCTRRCNPKSSMPCTTASASRGHLECRSVSRDLWSSKDKVDVCVPRFGRCYDDGDVCDPCRPYMPEDCYKCGEGGCKRVTGRTCVRNEFGEGVCRQRCDDADDCGDNVRLENPALLCALNQSSEDAGDKSCTADTKPNSQFYLKQLTCWP